MTKPEFHPFNIVRFMIERTRVLRATVRKKLDDARATHASNPNAETLSVVAELEATVKSPWLFHSKQKLGAVEAFHNTDVQHLNEIIRILVKSIGLDERHPALARMRTSAARDAWIGFAYVNSGYQVLLTQLASQHSATRSLRYYLRSRQYRAHSEDQVRRVQNAIFGEITSGRIIDPTRVNLLVRKGTITPEQEQRILDLRQRTRLGMGCLNPTSPPRSVAPDHQEGALCRVQRCTGCQHGVVFAESLVPLTRAMAELIFIQRSIPMASWTGSSFEDEFASIQETLKSFDRREVEAEISLWTEKLTNGEALPHDTYPSY